VPEFRRTRSSAEHRVLLITDAIGGLCNQLFRFAHIAAYAAETGATVAHPRFEHANAFPALRADPLCRFPARKPGAPAARRGSRALARGVTRMLVKTPLPRLAAETGTIDLGEDHVRAALRRNRMTLLSGWALRAPDALRTYADDVRALLALDPEYVAAAGATVERARADGDLVLGVHVRQGDYAIWESGRHFYDDRQYVQVMRSAQAAFDRRTIAFVVASSEPKKPDAFDGLPVQLAPGDRYGDLAALAACDLIVGPPSTFSAWASFMSGAPLAYVLDPASPLTPASFAPWHVT
jgi:hypothetical protein